MSIDFRCENCGKLLSIEDPNAGATKCPHCGKKVAVPAAVASLPRPIVAPNGANGGAATVAKPGVAAPPPPPAAGQGLAPEPESQMMTGMAKAMPWITSVFLHLGVGMILGFAAMIGQAGASSNQSDESSDVVVPDAAWSDEPGGVLNPSQLAPVESNRSSSVARSDYAKADSVADTGLTAKHAAISVAGGIGASVGSGTGKGDLLGLGSGGAGGPKSSLFGKGGNAHHVVYVIDKSGSMLDYFDLVRRELLNSIAKLKPVQDFHIIFFSSGKVTMENPPHQLVTGTPENRQVAAEFLAGVRPEGQTDPVPAMKRAFEVLNQADAKKKGKLLYLLTDAVDFDTKSFLEVVNTYNKQKEVHIITFLYNASKPGTENDESKLMKKVAEENGGSFKQISTEE